MSPVTPDDALADYLARLREALPPARSAETLAEVEALVADRVEREAPTVGASEAVSRALEALGSPERLADSLAGGGVTVDLATRRAFGRLLAVAFAGHLLLSVLLAVLGSTRPLVPGLVGALPTESWAHTALGALGIFFADAGLLLVLFVLLGRQRTPRVLARLRLRRPATRRDAVLSLVLVGLVAAIVNLPGIRGALFAVGPGPDRSELLGAGLLGLLPVANGMLALFAARHAAILRAGRDDRLSTALEVLACAAGVVLCVLVVTRGEFAPAGPGSGFSAAQGALLADLLLRIAILVAIVAGLTLAARGTRALLRLREGA